MPHHRLHVRAVRGIGAYESGLATIRLNLRDHLLAEFFVDIRDDHFGFCFGKENRCILAHTHRCAGDDGDFAVENWECHWPAFRVG
ncbi:hypothetical protein AADG42_00825 [Ammonicoccus fulvus]|uniref:Uncharacterized protein n=1 Tax=Ammonicoccus fulvus TaxID=3138240 RepID=A0ABZ3FIQ7_9ACTN